MLVQMGWWLSYIPFLACPPGHGHGSEKTVPATSVAPLVLQLSAALRISIFGCCGFGLCCQFVVTDLLKQMSVKYPYMPPFFLSHGIVTG